MFASGRHSLRTCCIRGSVHARAFKRKNVGFVDAASRNCNKRILRSDSRLLHVFCQRRRLKRFCLLDFRLAGPLRLERRYLDSRSLHSKLDCPLCVRRRIKRYAAGTRAGISYRYKYNLDMDCNNDGVIRGDRCMRCSLRNDRVCRACCSAHN